MTALGKFVTARLDDYALQAGMDLGSHGPVDIPRAEMDMRIITALRAVCILYEEAWERARLEPGVHDGRDDDERLRDEAVGVAVEDIMMHVASVWAGHPEFDRAWLQA